jgi:hypothetical protein
VGHDRVHRVAENEDEADRAAEPARAAARAWLIYAGVCNIELIDTTLTPNHPNLMMTVHRMVCEAQPALLPES